MTQRVSKRKLGEVELLLIPRDREIMSQLRILRFLKSSQVQRLFFYEYATPNAARTGAGRNLNRLKKLGLVDHLSRRIGGAIHGSSEYIWYLTEAGARLLDLGKETDGKRARFLEPSSTFMRHTLAVSECYVQFTEICRMGQDMNLRTLHVEPECWRSFQHNGKTVSLRPDLFAETVCGRFTDRWFIEMDLDTESTNSIIEKCRRYQHYYNTNREQEQEHVFPIVLWIVPTEDRKNKMIDAIRYNFGSRYPHFSLVITPKELWTTLIDGAKKEDLC